MTGTVEDFHTVPPWFFGSVAGEAQVDGHLTGLLLLLGVAFLSTALVLSFCLVQTVRVCIIFGFVWVGLGF